MPKDIVDNVCEEKIFSNIYTKFSKDLLGFLYYKFSGHNDCKDKMQEAFIKLWDNCKTVPPGKAKAFLFKVASNMMLNELKHEKVVMRYKQHLPDEYDNETPEFLIQEQEFLKKYQRALVNLTEEQRVAFLLFKAEGKRQLQGYTSRMEKGRSSLTIGIGKSIFQRLYCNT